jgi:hypothetical protein
MDERVEAFLRGVLKLDGPPSEVREAVRIDLAEYEKLFRDDETEGHSKDKAAQKGRELLRARVVAEMQMREGIPIADHLKLVLSVIDSPARFPLKD